MNKLKNCVLLKKKWAFTESGNTKAYIFRQSKKHLLWQTMFRKTKTFFFTKYHNKSCLYFSIVYIKWKKKEGQKTFTSTSSRAGNKASTSKKHECKNTVENNTRGRKNCFFVCSPKMHPQTFKVFVNEKILPKKKKDAKDYPLRGKAILISR